MSKTPPKKGAGSPGAANPLNPMKPQQPGKPGAEGTKPPPRGAPIAAPAAATRPAPAAPAGAGAAAAPAPALKPPPKGAPAAASGTARPSPGAPQAAAVATRAPGPTQPRPRPGGSDQVKVGAGKVTLSKGTSKAGSGAFAQRKAEAGAAGKDKGAPAENVEERVLELPEFKDLRVPKLFQGFVEQIVPRLDLAPTSRDLLRAFSNIDVTAERVSQVLKQNPYYEQQFYKVIESMGRNREEIPRLEGAVIMLGMQNSRNLVLALQALRTVCRTHPEWDKNGKLKVTPADILKYALKCEEMLAGNKSGHADTAYAAGLVFDMFALASQDVLQDNQDKKRVSAYIDSLFMHSLKSAQVALEISKSIPDFAFKKYLFSACLVHDIGKAAMAILDPTYLDFLEECSKRDVARAVRQFAEAKRFGVAHAALSALVCNYSRMFRPIEKAILCHHEPYLLARGDRNLFQLAQLVCLATNVASNYKRTDRQDDPIIALWKGPELAGFRLDNKTLITAVARVG